MAGYQTLMNRRLLLLIAAATGLAVYVANGEGGRLMARLTDQGAEALPPRNAGKPAPSKSMANPVALNPLSELKAASLDEITNRPLFNPLRKPAPPPPPAAADAPVEAEPVQEAGVNPDDFALLAIASGDFGRTAVVRWNPTNEVSHLKLGQQLSGWEITEVGDREVTIGRDGKILVLKLFEKPAQPPTADLQNSEQNFNQQIQERNAAESLNLQNQQGDSQAVNSD
jgi:hypothetical protein